MLSGIPESAASDGVRRLRELADFLNHLADGLEKYGELDALPLDVAVGQVTAARREIVGAVGRKPGPGAKTRIRRYLEERVGEVVYGEELAAVAGISEWARRVRELREEGLVVEELGGSRYRLTMLPEN
jgi:biotin operon repressor